MKVLIAEMIWQVGIDKLLAVADVEYDPTLWKNRELLLERVKDVNALIVRNQTKVDKELLRAGKKIQVIGRLGVGLDNIDVGEAKKLEKKIVYARNANAISVAEYVIGAMLDANRTLAKASESVKNGNWDRKHFTGEELYGKTIGLLGVGEIAQRVARRATAFGMNVLGCDPYFTPYDFPIAECGVQLTSFDNLLAQSDFLSIHVPLTPATTCLFTYSQFSQMKKTAYLINTSRGGIINETDLYRALLDHELAGAYLDVLEEEPPQHTNRLLTLKNAIITPHIAGLTEESQDRTSVLVAEEVINVLHGENALCIVK
ncbi:hydroxyacid dehydrogenase [Alkalihalobacillus oceani]|uniref:hydroxyacid dehydrogenase n=1 Tax=Halalkalibacter oceani TaxID=1653776 RepID=UPI00203BB8DD|nr:hydroxyacid dehydrogenase [Halalkalibacter oceani]MCM3761854.1 hydroxyacid dehydrogenase [Halalkalibacter oceani]